MPADRAHTAGRLDTVLVGLELVDSRNRAAREIRAGRVSRREAVEAAIARTRLLDERLTGLAVDRYSAAVHDAVSPHHGYFA